MLSFPTQTDGIHLRGLLPKARFLGARDIHVQSCTTDASQCRPGDLFVAVVDDERDGHEDAAEAVGRGARAVLAERLLPLSVPTCLVGDTRTAYGRICQALAGSPCDHLNVIGVTGSNGKTSTSHLIASIFREAREKAATITCLRPVGNRPSRGDATPAPHDLARSLHTMARDGISHAVVELSDTGLAQRRVAGMHFSSAVLTNVRRDHAEKYGSIRQFRSVTGRVFEQMKAESPVVLNADDPASHYFLDRLPNPVLTFGIRNDAELTATVLERQSWEQTFLLHAGPETYPVCTRMIGDHHVYNCLAAAAIGLLNGVDLATIVRGLERVDSLPGRLERVECGQSFSVFIDSARTPDALTAALRSVRQVTRGRVLCVMGAEGERHEALRPQLGRVLDRLAHVSVLTSDDPRSESPLEVVHQMLDGYNRPGKALVRPDRRAAIHWAFEQARPGDAVVIAGKGELDTQEIGPRVLPWSDRDIAREWLYGMAQREQTCSPRPALKIFG